MINTQMIELLLIFSVAVWALLSKTPIKALVKMLAIKLFNWSFPLRKRFLPNVPSGEFEQYVVKFFAALITLMLIGIAQVIDIAMITDNLSTEWQWLENAELISAVGVISLIPVKYSELYYIDLLLTVALISVVGSAGIHRLEKWLTGNGLLFDLLRQWLLSRGQARDLGDAVAADKLSASSESAIKAHKEFVAEMEASTGQPSPEAIARIKQLGFLSGE